MAKGSAIQILYELCKKTLTPSAVSPSSKSILKLCSLMDTISPEEVGLKEDVLDDDRGHGFFESNPFKSLARAAQWAQPITYLHIYECDSFTIGIFCLPTSSVIPLHDHPGMTVLSKILYGSLHVKAYDWVEPPCIMNSGQPSEISVKLAKHQADTVLTAPCPTRVLYPKTGGNLHCFTAITSVAVLDVLSPPYSEQLRRNLGWVKEKKTILGLRQWMPLMIFTCALVTILVLLLSNSPLTLPYLTTARVMLSRILHHSLALRSSTTQKLQNLLTVFVL